MAGKWLDHVKATWKKSGGSYKDAMKKAAKTWKKSAGGKKKKVQIREDHNEVVEADKGGAIRRPVKQDVAIDVKRIEMEQPLMAEYEAEDTDEELLDEDAGAYSHMGG